MLATMFFHLFLNFFQEKIAITPQTKIIETGVLIVIAAILVAANKKLFFEKDHVGRLLEAQMEEDVKSGKQFQKVSAALDR